MTNWVGGKGANLGEMVRAGIPVPPGFAVTAEDYCGFIEGSGEPAQGGSASTPGAPPTLTHTRYALQLIRILLVRGDLLSYRELGGGSGSGALLGHGGGPSRCLLCGPAAHLPERPGRRAASGCRPRLLDASLFESREIFYRVRRGFNHFQVKIAVPVQRMVQSEVSRVMFTVEQSFSNPDRLLIEAVYGLGEAIVSGEVRPDV